MSRTARRSAWGWRTAAWAASSSWARRPRPGASTSTTGCRSASPPSTPTRPRCWSPPCPTAWVCTATSTKVTPSPLSLPALGHEPRAPLAAPTAPNPTLPLSLHPRPPVLLQRPNQTAAAHLQGQVHAAPAARFHSENGSAAGRAGVGPGPALRLSLPLRLTGPPVPGPQVWCGSFQVTTGLQVPSSVRCLQKRDSATSSSNTSLT